MLSWIHALLRSQTLFLVVTAGGTASQAPLPILGIQVDDGPAKSFEVDVPPSAPRRFELALELGAGTHAVRVKSTNYVNEPGNNVTNQLIVSAIDAESEAKVVPAARAKVYTCEPAQAPDAQACYESIVSGFAERAYRRPLTDEEAERVRALWRSLRIKEGDDAAVALVVRALLVSPSFLYRASFTAPGEADARGTLPLDDYTLASRLSYFLWSSMPDPALFADAKSGALRTDQGLNAAVLRMLSDPRAAALHESFAAQWLNARPLAQVMRDPQIYPDFDEPLRAAMAQEVQQFFGAFLRSELPLYRLLDPGFAFVNDRLARHYGLPEPGSAELTRVSLPPGARGGVLWQGAWLTVSSEANRTSPVKRGRFVLERFLCRDVPPPPPNIPPFHEPEGDVTMRQRLAEHRKSPACAGCHNILDPVGLGLEELDGIGRQRSVEAGAPLDTSGGLPESAESPTADVPYAGAAQLVSKLKDDPRFARCLTRNLLGYALGRSVTQGDSPELEALTSAQTASTSLPQLLRAIALSPAFRRQAALEVEP